ncbi:LLM class F420-dependent oxidoreductase [Flavisphingomonas formosensis]|uniref:LLM class F420-dependent oxidoreductase n=1 Tax=Flavisphingomonas formosensis TaxID=861534 RepID=UPI0012F79102|nr:LLM class F420-dependent oxidoreductase [Sphingomonas formosensis]
MKFTLSAAFTAVTALPRIAIAADEAGWAMITTSDHVVNPKELKTPYPYTADGSRRWPEKTDWPDQLVTMGALATITKQIQFTTNAFVLPMRSPYLVAKALSTVSVLSNNRAVLTVGVGWSRDEFEILGEDFSTRGKRTDEMIEIMRLLWTGDYVEYHGKHYDFPPVEMNPKPAGHIPIWSGGISEAALKRVARVTEGWLSDLQPAADIVASIKRIRELRKDYGREDAPLEVLASPMDVFDVDGYRRLEDEGVTHILMQPWMVYHPGTQDVGVMVDDIKRYADDVIAKLS